MAAQLNLVGKAAQKDSCPLTDRGTPEVPLQFLSPSLMGDLGSFLEMLNRSVKTPSAKIKAA